MRTDKDCPCNCHDEETRTIFEMEEHQDCEVCAKMLQEEEDAITAACEQGMKKAMEELRLGEAARRSYEKDGM